MSGQHWDISSEEYWQNFCEYRMQMILAGKKPVVQFVDGPGLRTRKQNKAMWKLFRIAAQKLKDAGIDARKFFKPEVEIPVTPEMLHEEAFNKIAMTMYGKTSSELDRPELSEVGEVFIRHFAQSHGIALEWPQEDR